MLLKGSVDGVCRDYLGLLLVVLLLQVVQFLVEAREKPIVAADLVDEAQHVVEQVVRLIVITSEMLIRSLISGAVEGVHPGLDRVGEKGRYGVLQGA